MSKMGNLYLELSEKLEKTVPDFKDALECGCNSCENLVQVYISIEYLKKEDTGVHAMSAIAAGVICDLCGKGKAVTGRIYQSDNGAVRTLPVCRECVKIYEASK